MRGCVQKAGFQAVIKSGFLDYNIWKGKTSGQTAVHHFTGNRYIPSCEVLQNGPLKSTLHSKKGY